jgi:hypothetical protein
MAFEFPRIWLIQVDLYSRSWRSRVDRRLGIFLVDIPVRLFHDGTSVNFGPHLLHLDWCNAPDDSRWRMGWHRYVSATRHYCSVFVDQSYVDSVCVNLITGFPYSGSSTHVFPTIAHPRRFGAFTEKIQRTCEENWTGSHFQTCRNGPHRNRNHFELKAYVDALLEVHTKLSKTANCSFKGEAGFVVSLDRVCREFVNRNAATDTLSSRSPQTSCEVHGCVVTQEQ